MARSNADSPNQENSQEQDREEREHSKNSSSSRRREASRSLSSDSHSSTSRRRRCSRSSSFEESRCRKRRKTYSISSSSEGSRASRSRKRQDSGRFIAYFKKLDEKHGNLEENISKNSQLTNNKTKKLEKKLRDIDKAKIFKHKGNERNYLFNWDLAERIEESISLFKKNDTKTASKNLKNCLEIIRTRNKLIILADKSEASWAIVQEYQTDELASDTDNDRKIRRAETAALEIKKQWKFQSKRPHPQPSGNDSGTGSFLPTVVKSLPNPLSTGQHHNFRGYEGRPQSYPVQKGSCHACGVFGHWRRECKSIQNFRLPKSGYLTVQYSTVQYSIVPPKDERCHHGVKLNRCRTNSANSLLDCVRRFAWSADTPSRSAAFNQGSL